MGPIVRASDFIPQIKKDITISEEDVAKVTERRAGRYPWAGHNVQG